jgi:NADH-quinone oxidoreductase subunit F
MTQTPTLRFGSAAELTKHIEAAKKAAAAVAMRIVVSSGTCGEARGSKELIAAFEAALAKLPKGQVELRVTGCHGYCEREPLVVIEPKGVLYQRVEPKDVPEILAETVGKGAVIERLLYRDEEMAKAAVSADEVPYYKKQLRLVSGANGKVDPTKIEDYYAIGGYAALAKALSGMKPEAVVEEIKKSGLRGRGGGGFPTGRKWETVRKAQPGQERYVICNADEGDPGAYMDRSLLEGNPHSVLEGMIIGAYAIGAAEGIIYVRNEYPMAVKNAKIALEAARAAGLLGKNILGSGFDFDITICRGGGAFVCGESTALMASLEGKIGEPRAKYIHTAEHGLYDKPSCLNNVETWANVPIIIDRGADWFAKIGTATSKGTKIFSVVGKIKNTGLVEVPMGMKLREMIFDIGGGIPGGKKFKAVQTGGPSGGCLPESQLDLPIDFDALAKAGSMMGSGGLIVMDEDTCMVEVARYFTEFLAEESCGKCVPCREGVRNMLWILTRICEGKGEEGDVALLEEMSEAITDASLCALGSTAPNPVLSTIHYFRSEYEAHIRDKRCPAHVCKALTTYRVDTETCTGCTACARACPTDAAVATDKQAPAAIKGKRNEKLKLHTIVQDKCIKCGMCFEACNYDAIRKS